MQEEYTSSETNSTSAQKRMTINDLAPLCSFSYAMNGIVIKYVVGGMSGSKTMGLGGLDVGYGDEIDCLPKGVVHEGLGSLLKDGGFEGKDQRKNP